MDADEAHRPTAVPWPPILFTGALVAAVLLGRFYRLPWPGLDDRPARMVGYAFGVVGIALMIWGLATLYQAKTNVLAAQGCGSTDHPWTVSLSSQPDLHGREF